MRTILLALLATTALSACGQQAAERKTAAPPAESVPAGPSAQEIAAETARLNEWFEARYDEALDFSPMTKTQLGMKEDYDRIDDHSEDAMDEELAWRRGTVEALKRDFDYDRLTPEAQTSYDLWVRTLEQEEGSLAFRRHPYLIQQMYGAHSILPNFLINLHKVDTEEDMTAYIARIEGISRALGQVTNRARAAAEEGIRPPRFAYEMVLDQAEALNTGAPFDGRGEAPLFTDAKAKIAALEEAGEIDAERASTLVSEVRRALIGSFQPAYSALIAFIEEDLPNTSEEPKGAVALPNGEAYYQNQLEIWTTTDMTADEVHELGLSEVARIRAEMEAIKDEVGFEGTLDEFFAYMREDERFYFPNTDEGREAYLQMAREHLLEIDKRLPDYFGILPKADLVVKRVEAFREQDGAAQHYRTGTPDGSRPGTFYVHLSDMSAMPVPQLEVIAYHEGNPGHHMQLSIAQEVEGLPTFRGQQFYGVYSEGWALYSELLAKEMGAFENPYSDFGRLTTEIWRAIRLVVDTGMHDKGWSEEEAVAYFMANSPAAEGQIRSEIKRYLVWPGQATSYKIGMMKILELREEARAELGEDFDIRGFHDTVLGGGALPLSMLEERVDAWVEAVKKAQA